jgi:hypothetical protein
MIIFVAGLDGTLYIQGDAIESGDIYIAVGLDTRNKIYGVLSVKCILIFGFQYTKVTSLSPLTPKYL